jgi:hypothetical protein
MLAPAVLAIADGISFYVLPYFEFETDCQRDRQFL